MGVDPSIDAMHATVGGTVVGDNWSFGIWWRIVGLSSTPTPAEMNASATDYLSRAVSGLWTPFLKAKNCSSVTITNSRLALYRGGTITATGTASSTNAVGTGTSPQGAYCARVFTLLTGLAGRSNRGRVYLPWTGSGIGATTMQFSSASSELASFKSWLTDVNTNSTGLPGTPGWVPGVMSLHLSTWRGIDAVRVDSIPDTQRGRQSKFVPAAVDSVNWP